MLPDPISAALIFICSAPLSLFDVRDRARVR
jgi:hypothetical protein